MGKGLGEEAEGGVWGWAVVISLEREKGKKRQKGKRKKGKRQNAAWKGLAAGWERQMWDVGGKEEGYKRGNVGESQAKCGMGKPKCGL